MSSFDLYAELQAALNKNSLYYQELNMDLNNYVKIIINELTPFFRDAHKKMFRKTV